VPAEVMRVAIQVYDLPRHGRSTNEANYPRQAERFELSQTW
jgi:hypothetical protein